MALARGVGRYSGDGANEEEAFRLHDVNFEARPGEMVAVVGRVASGKSTLVSAMLQQVSPS